jgi:hypothetical protein
VGGCSTLIYVAGDGGARDRSKPWGPLLGQGAKTDYDFDGFVVQYWRLDSGVLGVALSVDHGEARD